MIAPPFLAFSSVSPVMMQGAAYLAALIITLLLAAFYTPRHWWRRLNLRAISVTLGGTLILGQLLLHWLWPAQAAMAAGPVKSVLTTSGKITAAPTTPTSTGQAAISKQSFMVHRNLNLRRAAGVQAARLGTVPAGALVTPSGVQQGDWWHISACYQGQCSSGWVSSLWLRRSSEVEGSPDER